MSCDITDPNAEADAPPRRFAGIARLYGRDALRAFQQARVCVVGIGGVGSWAAEALARSGMGALTLVDLDHVSESNTNRQIHALEPDFGKAKVQAMRARIGHINPDCRVACVEDFITPDNIDELLDVRDFAFVVDCADRARAKAALIGRCRHAGGAVVTVGGTGGRRDPSRIRVDDLARSEHDPLLARTRRELRRHHGFRGSGAMGVTCVYSMEQPRYPQADGSVAPLRTMAVDASLHCGGLGSATHLTGSFAFAAAAAVLEGLARRASPVTAGAGRPDAVYEV